MIPPAKASPGDASARHCTQSRPGQETKEMIKLFKPPRRAIAAGAPLPGIEHIVVVMLENRSFDNLLGTLYPPSSGFDGIPAGASNSYKDVFDETITVAATNTPPSGNKLTITPFPDPGESFDDMSEQIFGHPSGTVPAMAGFAQNYYEVNLLSDTANPGDIMCYFTPDQLAVTSALASGYAVCDQWFAAGPVQTFPNRMFCHCATPSTHTSLLGNLDARVNDADYVVRLADNIEAVAGAVTDTSIFELLDGTGGPDPANWKVYFHDVPLSVINSYVNDAWTNGSPCVASYDGSDYDPPYGTSFLTDVVNDNLPSYSFIEPRYYDNYSGSGLPPNSNHPGGASFPFGGKPIDVIEGELFLLNLYATLALSPQVFEKTLLIVTYDEHGGTYDHVGPNTAPFAASAPSPFTVMPSNFDFTSLGVRVPTFFVNPSIPSGTVYRPPPPQSGKPYYPFDHTSIIATLCAQFGLAGPLTPRDAAAPILSGLISQGATPRPEAAAKAELARLRAWANAAATVEAHQAARPGPRKTPAEHDRLLVERVRAKQTGQRRYGIAAAPSCELTLPCSSLP
jgi:phospholipase C